MRPVLSTYVSNANAVFIQQVLCAIHAFLLQLERSLYLNLHWAALIVKHIRAPVLIDQEEQLLRAPTMMAEAEDRLQKRQPNSREARNPTTDLHSIV